MMYGYGNMGGLAALWVVVWLVVIGRWATTPIPRL